MEKIDPSIPTKTGWREIGRSVWIYRWRVAVCVVAFAGLAVSVAMLRPKLWRAETTVLLVPQDAGEKQMAEFDYDARYRLAMQMANVRQIVRSDEVLAEVLRRAPDNSPTKGNQPLDALRERIEIQAPKPHEFGNTEMFCLAVKHPDRNQALVLAATIKEVTESRINELTAAKARTLVRQESDLVEQARREVAEAEATLKQIENRAGPDRSDLVTLANSPGSQLILTRSIVEARNAYQALQGKIRAEQSRLKTLKALVRRLDEVDLAALPSNVLNQDPVIQMARTRLSDLNGQLRKLRAVFTEYHPRVRAVQRELNQTAAAIRKSVRAAVAAAEDDLTAMSKQVDYLAGQEQHYQARLVGVQALKSEYAVAADALQQAVQRWRDARHRLAQSQSIATRARHAERLVYVDPPKILDRPVGPGRTTIVLAGVILGLLAGVAVAMLSRQSSTLIRTESDLRRAAPEVPILGTVRRVNRVFKAKVSGRSSNKTILGQADVAVGPPPRDDLVGRS